jgi:hypothetical protein
MSDIFKTAVKVKMYAGKVEKRIGAKKRRVLFKAGAYGLKSYRRAQRYRNKPSKKGEPPSAHKRGSNGPKLREASAFIVDLNGSESVVIGPFKFSAESQPTGKSVAELLNTGGPVEALLAGQPVIAQVEPRPFIAPLFTDGGKRFNELIGKEPL